MPPSNKYDKKKKENQKEGEGKDGGQLICCVPADKVFCQSPEIEALSDAVKCTCSSGKCSKSGFMHTECFSKYEEIIVGYMSKAGRGRTWNDKQRYSNVWANKGYDLVFKSCVCDCGHGSLRKDVDWVAPKAVQPDGAAVLPAEKKKKKEKAVLKPKLNFAVQNVSGSYYGSNTREEQEEGEDKPAPSLPSMRAFVREPSMELSVPPSPGTPASIPGLASLLPIVRPRPDPAPPRAVERTASQASLAGTAAEAEEPGWITVSKTSKERSDSGSRRNSVHTIKQRETPVSKPPKQRKPSGGDSSGPSSQSSQPVERPASNASSTSNGAIGGTLRARAEAVARAQAGASLSTEAAKKLKNQVKSPLEALATSRPTPSQSPFTAPASFPSLGLPMFGQPQASVSSFSAYSTPTPPPSSFYTSAYESALTYSSKDSVAAKPFSFGSELGARPKAGQKLSSSPEDIYQSDEEDMHRTVEGLLKESPALTPGWEEAGGARPGARVDAEREMEQIWEQTQYFEQLVQQEEPEPAVGLASGKRDANGFIHCNSCKTTHNSTAEFTLHCRTGKHLNNTMLAKKMSAGPAELGPVGSTGQGLGWEPGMSGWEAFGQSGGTWDPAPGLLSAGASRADTPERRAPDDEAAVLRAELDRERAAKAKALAEVAALQSGKRLIEKQALIVENTLKAEEAKVKEYKELSERLSRELKRKEFSTSESSGERGANPMAGEVDRLKMKELEAALAAEASKGETNGKVIKKLKEKVERVEKVAQREKDSRLLAEKTAELAGREQVKELARRRDLETRLDKMEEKMKEEMRKRILTELDMKSQKEEFDEKAEEIARDHASLEAAAEELMQQKDEVESRSRADLDTAEEALQARGNGEDARMKIFQDCEDIVKKSLAKAVEANDNVDDLEEVKMIFKMVNEAVQNSSSSPVAHIDELLDVPEVAGIVESFKAGLEEMRMCVENDEENKTSVKVPETKEDEKMTEEHEDAEVETVKKAEAEADKKAKQPKIVDIKSCSSDDDQETKEETSTAVEFYDVGEGEVEDPFDKLLPSKNNPKTDESQVESSHPEETADTSSEQEKQFEQVEEEKQVPETAEQEAKRFWKQNEDGEVKEASERCDSSTSGEVAGLDRHPKLGLDHEIDPYLGSPSVSRASTPGEEMEKDGNRPKQDQDDTLKAEEDVLTEERGEKEKQQYFRSPELDAGPSRAELEAEFSSPSGSPATSSTAWPAELSDSSTSGIGSELKELLEEPGAGARLHCLESNVAELQHMLVSLGNTVRTLTDQADESNYKNLVLNKLVEEEKCRSGRLERAVESASARSAVAEARMEEMAGKHSLLERRMSQKQLRAVHGALETAAHAHCNDPDELSGMNDSLLELLGQCENFQKGFDDMTDQQKGLEGEQKALLGDMEQQKAKHEDLQDQFGKLSDKFASLNLECQVDKGTTRQQMEQLGYSIALLTTKLPSDNFPSHKDSSTSGIKSQDSSEADTNPVTPPPAAPSAESVKSIVSNLVFANEQAAAADPKRTSCSPKPMEKPKPKQETAAKSRKLVYAQTAVNHLPQPSFPGVPGMTTWMSPDGSMMAVPPVGGPASGLAAGPGAALAVRPPLQLPYGLQGRGLGQMGAGPYPGPPTMLGYPLNYPLYYAPPR